MTQRFLTTCAIATLLMTASVYSIADNSANSFGEAGQTAAATRTVTIGPTTKYVDVKTGEIVNFNVEGKSFVWNFDGKTHKSKFDMGLIAPAGLLKHKVMIYIDRVPPNDS
jgi:hypothetical protein